MNTCIFLVRKKTNEITAYFGFLCLVLTSGVANAGLPTPVDPSSGAANGNFVIWLQGWVGDSAETIALIISTITFLWCAWIIVSKFNETRLSREPDWGSFGLTAIIAGCGHGDQFIRSRSGCWRNLMTEGEPNELDELLPIRLNSDPPVFRGCSLSELLFVAAISAVVLIPILVVLLGFFGYAMMGVGLGFLSTIGGVVFGATVLQKLKRGRPIGHYQLQIILLLDKLSIKKAGLITRGGHWSIGRTNR